MAGMGGGGAGVTALLARRSWLLVRGQHRVLRGWRGIGLLPELCGSLWSGAAQARVCCCLAGGGDAVWAKDGGQRMAAMGGQGSLGRGTIGCWCGAGEGRCCWAGGEAWMRRMAAMVLEGVSADWGIGRRRKTAMPQGGT